MPPVPATLLPTFVQLAGAMLGVDSSEYCLPATVAKVIRTSPPRISVAVIVSARFVEVDGKKSRGTLPAMIRWPILTYCARKLGRSRALLGPLTGMSYLMAGIPLPQNTPTLVQP